MQTIGVLAVVCSLEVTGGRSGSLIVTRIRLPMNSLASRHNDAVSLESLQLLSFSCEVANADAFSLVRSILSYAIGELVILVNWPTMVPVTAADSGDLESRRSSELLSELGTITESSYLIFSISARCS